jgi:hypothetical protein
MHYGANNHEQDFVLARMDDAIVTYTDPKPPTAAQGNCFGRPPVLTQQRDCAHAKCQTPFP